MVSSNPVNATVQLQPNSLYVQTASNGTIGVQNTITNSNGMAVGQVDFKPHGVGSGHAHVFSPGIPSQGHHNGGVFSHIPFSNVPSSWSFLPTGVQPSRPIGQ